MWSKPSSSENGVVLLLVWLATLSLKCEMQLLHFLTTIRLVSKTCPVTYKIK